MEKEHSIVKTLTVSPASIRSSEGNKLSKIIYLVKNILQIRKKQDTKKRLSEFTSVFLFTEHCYENVGKRRMHRRHRYCREKISEKKKIRERGKYKQNSHWLRIDHDTLQYKNKIKNNNKTTKLWRVISIIQSGNGPFKPVALLKYI